MCTSLTCCDCVVTERARKLRAQYAEQANSLKQRLETRLLRVPQALRKRKMADLVDELAAKEKPINPPAPQAISVQRGEEEEQAGKVVRGVKRPRYVFVQMLRVEICNEGYANE